jgi:hypothetical protein
MPGAYYWQESAPLIGAPTVYSSVAGPPPLTLFLYSASNTRDRLDRTVADMEYSITAVDNGVNRIPLGAHAATSVSMSIWADPTGSISAGSVPQPWQTTVRPFPIWTGLLYGTAVMEVGGTKQGWTTRYRPLQQIDVAAERGWVGPSATDVWMEIVPVQIIPFTSIGLQTTYSVNGGAKSLFQPM